MEPISFLPMMAGTILYYDGADFTLMPTPTDFALQGISGTSLSDVWAVGGSRYLYGNDDPNKSTILHYDGSTWSSVAPPTDSYGQYLPFDEIWCAPDGTAWAVSESTTQLARYSNGSWSFVSTGLRLSSFGFHTVYGFSATDVYAAGGCGQIIHYNGTESGRWNGRLMGRVKTIFPTICCMTSGDRMPLMCLLREIIVRR